jgi:hypothetical protein
MEEKKDYTEELKEKSRNKIKKKYHRLKNAIFIATLGGTLAISYGNLLRMRSSNESFNSVEIPIPYAQLVKSRDYLSSLNSIKEGVEVITQNSATSNLVTKSNSLELEINNEISKVDQSIEELSENQSVKDYISLKTANQKKHIDRTMYSFMSIFGLVSAYAGSLYYLTSQQNQKLKELDHIETQNLTQ